MSTNYWWYLFYSNSGNSIFDSILNGHESVAAEDENTKQVLWRYTQILTPYCNLHAGRSLFWGDPRDNRWWSHLICKKTHSVKTEWQWQAMSSCTDPPPPASRLQ